MNPVAMVEFLQKHPITHLIEFMERVGGETVMEGVLNGSLKAPEIESAVQLINKHGRVIPATKKEEKFLREDLKLNEQFVQPSIELVSRLARLRTIVPAEFTLPTDDQVIALMTEQMINISRDSRLARLFRGPHLYVIIPEIGEAGINVNIIWRYLLPWTFHSLMLSHCVTECFDYVSKMCTDKDPLKVGITPESRYKTIRERSHISWQGGWYFPLATQGWTYYDERQAMARFPEPVSLPGSLVTLMAYTMWPEAMVSIPNLCYQMSGEWFQNDHMTLGASIDLGADNKNAKLTFDHTGSMDMTRHSGVRTCGLFVS